jgi:putative glutamine amidotransferase
VASNGSERPVTPAVVSGYASYSADSHSRARIGVTTYLERAAYGVWEQESAVLPRSYVDAVVQAGGVPVLLPPVGDAFDVLVDGIDGLLLSGGADIGPASYGSEAHPETDTPRAGRDAFEFGLLQAALAAELPVLGVCRGCELLTSPSAARSCSTCRRRSGMSGIGPRPRSTASAGLPSTPRARWAGCSGLT